MSLALGLQVLLQPAQLWLMAQEIQPSAMVYFQPGDSVPIRPELTIGRFHYRHQSAELANDPEGFGERLARDAIKSADRNGIEYWVGPTEPPVASPDDCARLVACEKRRAAILNASGLKAVVFYLSVGWPLENVETHELYTGQFDAFLRHLPLENLVGVNEYFLPTGPLHPDSYDPEHPSRIWRFRHWPGIDRHRIFVTECGMDIGGDPETDGWVRQCPPHTNLQQWFGVYTGWMQDYRNLISQDDRVAGMAWYCAGSGYGWEDYNVLPYWQQAQPLFVTPREQLIRVRVGDEILEMPIEEYVRGVVPAEVFPDWNMEALKAQAVWARSVALNRLKHPREAGVCDITSYDQQYNVAKLHPRTDKAVRETEGVHLVKNGKKMYASYVSRCGLSICPDCDGWPGWTTKSNPEGIWPGRACQWGAEALAQQGMSWQDISVYYYDKAVELKGAE